MRLIARVAVVSCLALAGCFSSSDEDEKPVSVTLASTRLIGHYTLVDYLFEDGEGGQLDPSIVKVTGTLEINADSTYLAGIRVGADSTPTRGRITLVKARPGNRDAGVLYLTLESASDTGASSAGTSDFAFRGDTLVLITEGSRDGDATKKRFRETDYYLRVPAVTGD
jgi:hypothetical protein